jgi:hypothetical protein
MTRPIVKLFDGTLQEMSDDDFAQWQADQTAAVPTRAKWEASARKSSDEQLKIAIDVVNGMLGEYLFGSPDHTALLAVKNAFLVLTKNTSLAASTDEASAKLILLAAYNAIVSPLPTPLKIRYATAIAQLRSAGVKI